ncbi:MAG: HD domain-containing protein [Ruminiclostridium sp.]|nr:HD domain-containing protein [Ruminiclostridium sp.]
MHLSENIVYITDKLAENGYEAFVVGGCVRDYLLGQCPKDYDVTTSALPEQIIECFEGERLLTNGLKHGTVTVIKDDIPVEITTYRIDGDYKDHRHPEKVEFTSSLKEDLSRRDFTINAMAYSEKTGIVDYFGGREDLKNGIIRAVGNPYIRFDEDALRILRALRFSSRFGFEIERNTSDAIHRLRYLLERISVERIQTELCGILLGNCYDVLYNYPDVICEIIPELRPSIGFLQHTKYHNRTVYRHIIKATAESDCDIISRLTMLLHDIGKPDSFYMENGTGHFKGHALVSRDISEKVLKRLKFSNKITEEVLFLIENHSIKMADTEKYIKKALVRYGEEQFLKLIDIHIFDNLGKAEMCLWENDFFRSIAQHTREYLDSQPALTLKSLKVNGNDMMALGFSGADVGKALNFLMDAVIDEHCKNEKDRLIEYLKKNRKNVK